MLLAVSADRVAAQLLGHAAVKDAAVRLASDLTPARLKAHLVLHNNADTAQLHVFETLVLKQLPWCAAFSSITYGAAMPLNAMRKPSNWQAGA